MKSKFECKGKNKYDSRKEVYETIAWLQKESAGGIGDIRAYKCKFCHKWHLTSTLK